MKIGEHASCLDTLCALSVDSEEPKETILSGASRLLAPSQCSLGCPSQIRCAVKFVMSLAVIVTANRIKLLQSPERRCRHVMIKPLLLLPLVARVRPSTADKNSIALDVNACFCVHVRPKSRCHNYLPGTGARPSICRASRVPINACRIWRCEREIAYISSPEEGLLPLNAPIRRCRFLSGIRGKSARQPSRALNPSGRLSGSDQTGVHELKANEMRR